MQFGVVVFNRGPLSSAEKMVRWARRAETLGYDFPAHDPPGSRSSAGEEDASVNIRPVTRIPELCPHLLPAPQIGAATALPD